GWPRRDRAAAVRAAIHRSARVCAGCHVCDRRAWGDRARQCAARAHVWVCARAIGGAADRAAGARVAAGAASRACEALCPGPAGAADGQRDGADGAAGGWGDHSGRGQPQPGADRDADAGLVRAAEPRRGHAHGWAAGVRIEVSDGRIIMTQTSFRIRYENPRLCVPQLDIFEGHDFDTAIYDHLECGANATLAIGSYELNMTGAKFADLLTSSLRMAELLTALPVEASEDFGDSLPDIPP